MAALTVDQQAALIIKSAKSIWFRISIERHPSIIWALENNLHIDFTSLSQHYELDTGYVDLTHDFGVAAFFATCKKVGAAWSPITSGSGIIYRLELQKIPEHLRELTSPVGLQPLPRPEEQGAWVTEVPMGHDFETHPGVTLVEFEHEKAVSEYFLERFDGGSALFPPDPMARIASHIKQSSYVPSKCIDAAIRGYAQEPGGLPERDAIRSCLSDRASDVEPSPILTDTEIEQAKAWWESRVRMFGYGTKVVPVRTVEIKHDS
jgi:hypothetical protein